MEVDPQRAGLSFSPSMTHGNETGPERFPCLSPDLQSHRDTGGANSQYPKIMLADIHK